MARKWTVASVARTCLEGPRLFAPAALDVPPGDVPPHPHPQNVGPPARSGSGERRQRATLSREGRGLFNHPIGRWQKQ